MKETEKTTAEQPKVLQAGVSGGLVNRDDMAPMDNGQDQFSNDPSPPDIMVEK